MIKASSLFYAVVISLIIAIVTSSLILFAYLSHIQFENFEINQRLQLNADLGLNLLLSKQSLVNLDDKKVIDLYEQGIDSVELTRKLWGAYEVVISKAIFRNTSVFRIAQIGYAENKSKEYSLYLSDENKPLSLCGKTIIKGTVFLPKAGVQRAYIEGQNFIGDNLITGQIKQSEKKLPEFNKELIKNIQSVFTNRRIGEEDSIIDTEGVLNDSLQNSFLNNCLVLRSKNSLRISGGYYSGNIAIISDKQITISSDAVLQDVIIFAPKVFVQKEFKGNLQVFASDSVVLEKNVTMNYPSVIGLSRGVKSPNVAAVILSENDSISGNLFVCKKAEETLKQSALIMDEKSFIYGQVYSNGYVDVKGTIYGSLICNKILLKTPSSIYENHLLNVKIDRSKLSEYFIGINLVNESILKKVLKWGY